MKDAAFAIAPWAMAVAFLSAMFLGFQEDRIPPCSDDGTVLLKVESNGGQVSYYEPKEIGNRLVFALCEYQSSI